MTDRTSAPEDRKVEQGQRLPFSPLENVLRRSEDEWPLSEIEVARRLRSYWRQVTDWRRRGMTIWAADKAAVTAGFHPAEVWGQQWWEPPVERDVPVAWGTSPVGANLRLERERRGWSQTMLADKSGISRTCIYNTERFGAHPKPDTVRAWAEALGTPVHELYGSSRQPTQRAVLAPPSGPLAGRLLADDG